MEQRIRINEQTMRTQIVDTQVLQGSASQLRDETHCQQTTTIRSVRVQLLLHVANLGAVAQPANDRDGKLKRRGTGHERKRVPCGLAFVGLPRCHGAPQKLTDAELEKQRRRDIVASAA